MSSQEPYRVTAVQRDGRPREWTRSSWTAICALYNTVVFDRNNKGFKDIKLWIYGADMIWRVADLSDPDLGFIKS